MEQRNAGGKTDEAQWERRPLLTRGFDSECCGDERTNTGTPRPGLVPEPLLPTN